MSIFVFMAGGCGTSERDVLFIGTQLSDLNLVLSHARRSKEEESLVEEVRDSRDGVPLNIIQKIRNP